MKVMKIFAAFASLLIIILIFIPSSISKPDDKPLKITIFDEKHIRKDCFNFIREIKKDNRDLIKNTIFYYLFTNKRQHLTKDFSSIETSNNNIFKKVEQKCFDYIITYNLSTDLLETKVGIIGIEGVDNHVEIIFPWITMLPPCYGIAFEVWLDHDTAILVTSGGGISSFFISMCGPIGLLLGALVAIESILLSTRIGPNGIHFLGVWPIVGIPAFPYVKWAEPL